MRRVLLLNITYEPLTTVCLPRAVCLVLGEKAEVVHEDADGARAPVGVGPADRHLVGDQAPPVRAGAAPQPGPAHQRRR